MQTKKKLTDKTIKYTHTRRTKYYYILTFILHRLCAAFYAFFNSNIDNYIYT